MSKGFTCELCGSTDIIKKNGAFVCQACGCKYSDSEVKIQREFPIQSKKKLTCDMCYSTNIINTMFKNGVFVCRNCGCKYTAAEVKKKITIGPTAPQIQEAILMVLDNAMGKPLTIEEIQARHNGLQLVPSHRMPGSLTILKSQNKVVFMSAHRKAYYEMDPNYRYWRKHPEEKVKIDNELSQLTKEIDDLKDELSPLTFQLEQYNDKFKAKKDMLVNKQNSVMFPVDDEVKRLELQIERLKRELEGMGLFKRKQKKEKQAQIDEVGASLSRTQKMAEEEHSRHNKEIDCQIVQLQNENDEKTKELNPKIKELDSKIAELEGRRNALQNRLENVGQCSNERPQDIKHPRQSFISNMWVCPNCGVKQSKSIERCSCGMYQPRE